jgi:hypothetical protein
MQKIEAAQLSHNHEKWRDLYVAEELPIGSEWKKAEAVDPVGERLFPDPAGPPPEWAAHPQA